LVLHIRLYAFFVLLLFQKNSLSNIARRSGYICRGLDPKTSKGVRMISTTDTGASSPGQSVNAAAAEAPESLDHQGALALAKRLEQYWHDEGYKAARFWAEPIGTRFAKIGTYDLYRVNCNLVNGLPPRYRDDVG
jgi:hypothetical protein